MSAVDDVGKLVHYLELCAETGSGAHLTPNALELLLLALRSHTEPVERSSAAFALHSFRIVAALDEGPEEILALSSDAMIASAIFEEAAKRRVGRKIRLMYGERILAQAP
jgi:hypothetical protein